MAGGNTRYDSRNNCNALIETASNTLILGSKNTVIPNTVTNIGDGAFENRLVLTSITIPASVNSIAYNAFYGCTGLESISVAGGNTRYDSRNNCNAIIETATNTLIQGCKNTVIPNTVTTIGNWAFNGCSTLTSIDIPASVTSIDGNAFYQCTSLEYISVAGGNTRYDSRNNCNAIIETASNTLIFGSKNTVIPNTVTNIGGIAFYCSTVLTSITIPASVTTIEQGAFDKCTALTTVFMQATTPPMIFGEIFDNCNALTVIYVPTGTAATYKADSHFSKYKDIIKEMSEITLADNASNSDLITMTHGMTLDVTLTRTYSSTATNWNTFCVPFDIDNATLKAKFGDDVEVAEYSENSTDANNITVSFTKMTEPAITANKPVLLRASAIPATVTFTGVTIVDEEPVVTGNYFDFVGSYTDKQYVETGNYYLSANKLYRSSKDNGTYIKGLRAYIKAKTANARVANFGINEDVVTEVNEVIGVKEVNDDSWYTLDGVKLDKQPTKKGMYINNGKKVVIK